MYAIRSYYDALEAGPTIPFPNFSKLFKTWLKILTALTEEQREGLFSAYIIEISQSPQKLITFNLDGILEIFLTLDENEREILVITSYSIHYTKLYECKFFVMGNSTR